MKQLLAMARKEFILWAQKPGSWVVILVVPLLFIWIMHAVFGSSGTPVITIYAVNEDESQASQQVMQALRQAENLQIEMLDTRSEADRRVGVGEHMAAVIIPEGFGSALTTAHGAKIDVIIDPARAEQASIVVGLLNAALGPFMIDAEVSRSVETGVEQVLNNNNPQPAAAVPAPLPAETPEPGATPAGNTLPASPNDTLKTFFVAAIKGVVSNQVQQTLEDPQIQLNVQPYEEAGSARRPSLLDYLVPGYSLMFMFFLVPNLAMTVLEERETGTLRRLLCAPVPRSRILLGKLLPYFLIASAQQILVLVASKYLFGVALGGSPIALGMIILSASLTMSSLGVMIAALARTQSQADGLAMIIVLTMAVVSGAMFPSISIPGIKMITPHYWAMQGFLNVLSRGLGVSGVMLPAAILLTMSAVFFTIGAVRFRFE
jgi:ABC-2 type transport system permease protein